MSLEIHKP